MTPEDKVTEYPPGTPDAQTGDSPERQQDDFAAEAQAEAEGETQHEG